MHQSKRSVLSYGEKWGIFSLRLLRKKEFSESMAFREIH